MTETVTQAQFTEFVTYMRTMLNDMAAAHVGSYPNNSRMQEIVVVWRPGDVSLDGYPIPENITHIKAEPHKTAMESGEYMFKHVVQSIMAAAGYKKCDNMSISKMKQGQYDCSMCSGCSEVYYFMLRTNGDITPALKAFGEIDDRGLREYCLKALDRMGYSLQGQAAAPVRAPVPGGP